LPGASADYWSNLGAAYYDMNDMERSMANYAKALEINPCSYSARRNLVLLYAGRHELQAAYRAGEVPSGCRLIPEQARELEACRREVGRP
jgi:tetratricopeptide (TPR) repeat protein